MSNVEITILVDDHEIPLDKDGHEVLGLINHKNDRFKFLITSYERSSWMLFIEDIADSRNTFPITSMPDYSFQNCLEPIKWLVKNMSNVIDEIRKMKNENNYNYL